MYLLEPHVKMSQGGLRDLHLLRWAAQGQYHTASLETLKHLGVLTTREFAMLIKVQEFLWRVRNELHFSAGRCQDRLTFEDQVRLAGLWGYGDDAHLLGVEKFMKGYYEQITALSEISHRLVSQMATRPVSERVGNVFRRRTIDGRFRIVGDEISILPEARTAVLEDSTELFRLFHLTQIHHVRLSHQTEFLIERRHEEMPTNGRINADTASMFLRILSQAGSVAPTLRTMHRMGWLETIIPEFSRTRGLMQFNEYHKYTIDEHCIRAVEEAESLLSHRGDISRVYGEISRKDLLHLALLVHDLGKGQGGDHSVIGVKIADDLTDRMDLDPEIKKLPGFLVRHHLLMTRIAFRRDLSDKKVLLRFAKTVATPEALKMLYILTLADIEAVGPGTLTAWKKDLLSELYTNVLEILTGENAVGDETEQIQQIKNRVLSRVHLSQVDWTRGQMEMMDSRYLLTNSPDNILEHLKQVQKLPSEQVLVKAEYDIDLHTTKYTIYAVDQLSPGIFYKIAGVMAARGLQILGATIRTWGNGTVVDTFQVSDPDFAGPPTPRRLEKVGGAMKDVLQGHIAVETLLAHGKRIEDERQASLTGIPTQVEVDNSSSDQFSIIEVFTEDRQGLLFIIARTMFNLGLSVQTAKISTQLDQVVDVFYVTNQSGAKILGSAEIQNVKRRISEEIERFHENPHVVQSNR